MKIIGLCVTLLALALSLTMVSCVMEDELADELVLDEGADWARSAESLGEGVRLYTIAQGEGVTEVVVDGVAPDQELDFPSAPISFSEPHQTLSEPLLFAIPEEALDTGEHARARVVVRDVDGQLVWTSSLALDAMAYAFDVPPEDAHDVFEPLAAPFVAQVEYCTWRGGWEGLCERRSTSRATVLSPWTFERGGTPTMRPMDFPSPMD